MSPEPGYRDILKTAIAERRRRNPAYSLRSLCRQLDLSPSLLSSVLRGKKKLSADRAFQISGVLKFSEREREVFTTLVQIEAAKSEELRTVLKEKLLRLQPGREAENLSVDVFRAISEWHHFALLEVTQVRGLKLSAASAARALGISKFEAELAIERLLRLELLENQGGKLRKTKGVMLTASGIPNEALRKYHHQTLLRAIESITSQSPKEKFIGSETFAFSEENLPEAVETIETCFRDLVRLSTKRRPHRDVYHCGIQLFRVTKKGKTHESP